MALSLALMVVWQQEKSTSQQKLPVSFAPMSWKQLFLFHSTFNDRFCASDSDSLFTAQHIFTL